MSKHYAKGDYHGKIGQKATKERKKMEYISGIDRNQCSINSLEDAIDENNPIRFIDGETAYTIYSGGTTREKFLDHLKNTLIPTLHEGDISSSIKSSSTQTIPENSRGSKSIWEHCSSSRPKSDIGIQRIP